MLLTSRRLQNDIIFAGAGHANMLALKMLAMNPTHNNRLTLVSRTSYAAYSGMVPGYLAGVYDLAEIMINLPAFCARTNVRFINAIVTEVRTTDNTLILRDRPSLEFDVLALNLGAQNNAIKSFQTIPTKPIDVFLGRIEPLLQAIDHNQPTIIEVIGAGAAGVEIAAALAHRRRSSKVIIHLYHNGVPLKDMGYLASKIAHKKLHDLGIIYHNKIWTEPLSEQSWLIQATQATPPNLIWDGRSTEVFQTNAHLSSIGHANIFITGDMATFQPKVLPRAGVYAVRSASTLHHNINALLNDKPMKAFRPQKDFLRLVSLGPNDGIAHKYGLAYHGRWVWSWKNYIDRKFLSQFHDIRPMMAPKKKDDKMICGGCAGKVSGSALKKALQNNGTFQPHDAAELRLGAEVMHWSNDAMRSFIQDEYTMAKIACQHAIGDILAVGKKPMVAMVTAALPSANDAMMARQLHQTMQGVQKISDIWRMNVIGGHSLESSEWMLSLSLGSCLGPALFSKKRPKEPCDIFITGPIGTGILMSAHMQGHLTLDEYDAVIDHLLRTPPNLNLLNDHVPILSATDITGYGISGHLLEMLEYDTDGFTWQKNAIPALPGVERLKKEFQSSLWGSNAQYAQSLPTHPLTDELLLHDPQTCGGFLIACAPQNSETLLSILNEQGHYHATCIGQLA
ncbi:MAG: selenide, water dikinase SelD [Alphaproteobacteria bacterium]